MVVDEWSICTGVRYTGRRYWQGKTEMFHKNMSLDYGLGSSPDTREKTLTAKIQKPWKRQTVISKILYGERLHV